MSIVSDFVPMDGMSDIHGSPKSAKPLENTPVDEKVTLMTSNVISEDMRQASTSGLSFRNIRIRDKLYIDKSLLIKDILDQDDSGVFLYTRPRRFGKSTNMTMLDAFFNLKYKDNTWFDDLAISRYQDYDRYRNKFPVISINLKDTVPVSDESYESFLDGFMETMRELLGDFGYLLESEKVSGSDKEDMLAVIKRTASERLLSRTVKTLCHMLHDHHEVDVIILIDEYDRALTDTFGMKSQDRILKFLSSFMSATLKDNECLQMAYITGIMQVAKSGMFSGVNNLYVNNILSVRSDERFGFTESEVLTILEECEHLDKMDEMREWYDGYRFGNTDVYNPFSLLTYVQSDFTPEGYWARSGNDKPIRWMLNRSDKESVEAIADIISGNAAVSDISMDMTYDDMRRTGLDNLLSLMVMTGYLRIAPRDDGRFDISVPNKEVMRMIDRVLKDMFPISDRLFKEFAIATMDGDCNAMEELLTTLLDDSSYFDLRDESDYKLAIFLCLHGMIWRYDVECERQKGNGRLDIILTPKDEGDRPIIMELKVSDTEKSLDSEASEGLRQIHERRYYHGMHGEVILYGMAFWGVVPKVFSERIVL